ncbi:hypothetical protein LP415_06740 [Polaromonas sp. P1(28)-8]|nr:hypothetical protein LP415_06740 [Polaromonas sp. P1(28)-8]
MSRIVSKIDTASPTFKKNLAAMTQKVEALQAKVHKVRFRAARAGH